MSRTKELYEEIIGRYNSLEDKCKFIQQEIDYYYGKTINRNNDNNTKV